HLLDVKSPIISIGLFRVRWSH
ncbi:hypothetical protein VCHENC02_1926B, partial [Vibrio harveyi]